MNFYSDFKELSSWIIGLACLAVLLIVVYTRSNKEKIKT